MPNATQKITRTFECPYCGAEFLVKNYSKLAKFRHGCEGSKQFFKDRFRTWWLANYGPGRMR
jgi:transcription elongation factor Elf1